MMRALLPLFCLATLVGCNAPAGEPTDATSGQTSPGQTDTKTGVAPMGAGTAAGGIAPMQGTESVTGSGSGGGGGTAQAAKGMARRAAGSAQGGSTPTETAPAEESGE